MQDYGFTKKDMKYLVSESVENRVQESNSINLQKEYSDSKLISKSEMPQQQQETILRSEHRPETSCESQKQGETSYTSRQQQDQRASQQQQKASSK